MEKNIFIYIIFVALIIIVDAKQQLSYAKWVARQIAIWLFISRERRPEAIGNASRGVINKAAFARGVRLARAKFNCDVCTHKHNHLAIFVLRRAPTAAKACFTSVLLAIPTVNWTGEFVRKKNSITQIAASTVPFKRFQSNRRLNFSWKNSLIENPLWNYTIFCFIHGKYNRMLSIYIEIINNLISQKSCIIYSEKSFFLKVFNCKNKKEEVYIIGKNVCAPEVM